MFTLFVLQFLSAVAFILFKKTLLYGPPFLSVALRMLAGGILFLGIHKIVPSAYNSTILANKHVWLLIILASIFNIYGANAYGLWGMQYVSAGITSLLYNTAPFISALLGYYILNETMNYQKWLGLIIGLIGLLPVILSSSFEQAYDASLVMLGTFAILVSACSSAIGWILIKKLTQSYQFPNSLLNGITCVLGGLLTLGHACITETIVIPLATPFIYYIGLSASISPVIYYLIYTYLLSRYSSTLLLFSGFITTFFTVILGAIFLGEAITPVIPISTAILMLGLYIFWLSDKKLALKSQNPPL